MWKFNNYPNSYRILGSNLKLLRVIKNYFRGKRQFWER